MVDKRCLPGRLNSFTDGWDRPTGFTGDDNLPNLRLVDFDLVLCCHAGEVQSVAGSAAEYGSIVFDNQFQTGQTTHSAARQHHRISVDERFMGALEADKRTIGKGQGRTVLFCYFSGI